MVNRMYVDEGFNTLFLAVVSDVLLREVPREQSRCCDDAPKQKHSSNLGGVCEGDNSDGIR